MLECQNHATTHALKSCFYTVHSIPTYRNIVEKMLQDPQTLENIITAAASLDNDPVVIGIGVQTRDLKMTNLW